MNASRASETEFSVVFIKYPCRPVAGFDCNSPCWKMLRSLGYDLRQARANTPSTRHVHAKYTAAMPLEAAPPLAAAHSISLACISMQEPFGLLLRR